MTEARAACLFLNVTIATKAQMEKALQHGLQTCRFRENSQNGRRRSRNFKVFHCTDRTPVVCLLPGRIKTKRSLFKKVNNKSPEAGSSHLSFYSPTSVHTSASSVSSPSLHTTTNNTAGPVLLQSVGAVPTTLIVLGIILLVLTAAGILWYYRLSIFPLWSRQQKDDIETEMWKHTDSEMDLHSCHEGEEEADRKSSSDVTLCVNPDIKTNSSE
ncbi:uncharacterized protein [Centroberyx affinis]|uniref:uncharacterized protein n=1 Tax=Centroberyx affinis TaxID=166261 RepID=UPI003A5BD60E